ncbi:MAG TPA: tetratricopeptide repeat protein, partial [Gammaproteobacteria bacterium]|nr:tetratricopeptide repeat protein [Gammaproteobacteria bacterium]
DVPAHHFHEQATAGARCSSCHMMTTDYMVIDPRHDHSMRIPRPDLSERLGVPNACNFCHVDRDAAWADARIREHYPQPKTGYQTFADALHAADTGATGAVAGLLAVVADPTQSAIARASALTRLSRRPTPAVFEVAVIALDDPSALVRSSALSLLEMLPPGQRTIAVPRLTDPDRIVRMAAARLLAPLSPDLQGPVQVDFDRAASEFVAAQRFNADRPEYRTNLGTFLALRGNAAAAAEQFDAALALDRRFVPAWVNLAELRRSEGREADAESLLRKALERVPEDPTLHHTLGLSLVRQSRYEEALHELAAASRLAPDNARFAYVHGVALHSTGRVREAVAALESALERNPDDYDVLATLASILRDAGEVNRARIHAKRLLEAYPDDPAAAALLESLPADPH